MTASNQYDDQANKSPGEKNEATVTDGDAGSQRAEYPTRSASSITELWLPNDGDADLDVNAYNYDDEPGQVELCVNIPGAYVTLNLPIEDAQGLASDLDDAATRVDDGNQ